MLEVRDALAIWYINTENLVSWLPALGLERGWPALQGPLVHLEASGKYLLCQWARRSMW